jgi:hypothetical protein
MSPISRVRLFRLRLVTHRVDPSELLGATTGSDVLLDRGVDYGEISCKGHGEVSDAVTDNG